MDRWEAVVRATVHWVASKDIVLAAVGADIDGHVAVAWARRGMYEVPWKAPRASHARERSLRGQTSDGVHRRE